MQRIKLEGFSVAGESAVTDNQTEFSGAGKIQKLWAQFIMNNPVINQKVFGVYSDFESNQNDSYKVTVGFKEVDNNVSNVSEDKALFGGYLDKPNQVRVSSGDYLVFPANGPMPESIINAWHEVWSHFNEYRHYVRTFKTDFEEYDSPTSASIYIGIKNK